jgi:hypothetical protein
MSAVHLVGLFFSMYFKYGSCNCGFDMFLNDSFCSTDHTLVNFVAGFCVMYNWCSLHLIYGDRLTLCKMIPTGSITLSIWLS